MTGTPEPDVGTWYENDEGDVFQVIAVDSQTGIIGIQYSDETTADLQRDDWDDMMLEQVESPEDWHGSMDESFD